MNHEPVARAWVDAGERHDHSPKTARRTRVGTDGVSASPPLTGGAAGAARRHRNRARPQAGGLRCAPRVHGLERGKPQPAGTPGDLVVQAIRTRGTSAAKPTDALLQAALRMLNGKIGALPVVNVLTEEKRDRNTENGTMGLVTDSPENT